MKKRRIISLITVTTIFMTMIIAADASVFAAAKYEVPVKITEYSNESAAGDPVWKKDSSRTYKYDKKGNLKAKGKTVYKWNYDKKKRPVKAKVKFGKASAIQTYKKGKLSKVTYGRNEKETFSYKKGWISKVSGNVRGNRYSCIYAYKFYKNGTPKSVTETMKAGGKPFRTTLNYNDRGLVTMKKYKGFKETFSYEFDAEGRVSARTTYTFGIARCKTVYKYNGTKTSNRKTYMGVMNEAYDVTTVQDAVPFPYPKLAK